MTTAVQRSFAGGELAPALYARTDQVKYATGARTLRNMIVQRHGGVTNRAGTGFVAESKNSAVRCRLIEFVLDATDIADTYLLEFGNGYLRFYQDGAPLVVSGVAAWATATAYAVGALVSRAGVNYYCRIAHTAATATNRPGDGTAWETVWYALTGTIYEIPTPYQTADLDTINYVQSGDIITLVHPSYASRELARRGHTDWALTTIAFGPSIAPPTNVAATGAGAAGTTYYAITAIKAGSLEESLVVTYTFSKVVAASTPATLTWNPVPGAISYNVYRSTDAKTYGLVDSSGGLPGPVTDTAWGTASTSAVGTSSSAYTAGAPLVNALAGVSATARAYDGTYTVRFQATLVAAVGSIGFGFGRYKIYYQRNTDAAAVLALTSFPIIVEHGGGGAAVGPISVTESIDVPDDGYTSLTITVVPEAMACDPVGDTTFTLDASNAPDNRVEWQQQLGGFVDGGSTPDYSMGPPTHPAIFNAPGRYPGVVTLYQQRRIFARSLDEPEKAWASRVGSLASFGISTPLQPDDALTFSLAGRQVNAIKHLLEVAERLVVFGSGRELLVRGDDAGILRPDAINPGKLSTNGSGALAPIEIDDSAIYLQGRGALVRDLKPIGADGYEGTDLTIFAAHLFEGYTVVDWAYQQNPHSVIWAVRSDGVLLGLTYLRDQAIWGWHWHETDGAVENVRVIPEGDEDAVYLVVRRTIAGETKRYIERMQPRFFTGITDAVFMDAALSYDGWHAGTTTLTLGVDAWDIAIDYAIGDLVSQDGAHYLCSAAHTSDADTEPGAGVDWETTWTLLEDPWGPGGQLLVRASAAAFTAANVGDAVYLVGVDDLLVRVTLEAYVSTTVMVGRPDRAISGAMREVAIGAGSGAWGLAVNTLTGLDHLEGKAVAVIGDGFVVASPNNAAYDTIVVAGGAITLPEPHVIVHVGLPYISDLETLDLDHPGPATAKDGKHNVSQVGLYVQRSRGIWVGQADLARADDPLASLQELKGRSTEDYDEPIDLLTDFVLIPIESNWNSNGRILVRQVDPLPMTILSATPIGHLAQ